MFFLSILWNTKFHALWWHKKIKKSPIINSWMDLGWQEPPLSRFANLLFLQQELSCCNWYTLRYFWCAGTSELQKRSLGFFGIFSEGWCHFNGVHQSCSWLSHLNNFQNNIKPVATSLLIFSRMPTNDAIAACWGK